MVVVYGIKQCDTCCKALKWLKGQGIEHRFHDLRVDGLDRSTIEAWLDSEFAEQLLNRRSTTWRQLDESQRNANDVAALILEFPTLLKRPVFSASREIIAVGFSASVRNDLLEKTR
ncbi:MAG: Spx/MgsR family RNA polymerase-binding regulatory protein [Xanthomonadales bacterium]|nr:Spx/MgsR family RNA polymerase-binding regulatory protein [Xanthomonadales bacterium]